MVNNVDYLPWWTVPAGILANFALIGIGQGVYGTDKTIENAELSYVQPDSTTFSVWSIIYTFQVFLAIYQSLKANRDCERIRKARAPLIGNYLTNGLWLVSNGAANSGLSFWLAVVVLVLNVYCLYRVYRIFRIDYSCPQTSWKRKVFAYTAISLNVSWVLLASILNFSNTLFKPAEVSSNTVQIGSADWAIAVVAVACVVASYLAFTRFDIGYVLVFCWAAGGIYRAQQTKQDKFVPTELSPTLGVFALASIGVAVFSLLVGGVCTYYNWHSEQKSSRTEQCNSSCCEDCITPCSCKCCSSPGGEEDEAVSASDVTGV